MLKYLKLENVGPSPKMELELGSRLNIITGDNGLGKSFLLDVAWFVNVGEWPKEINGSLTSGYKALPREKSQEAIINTTTDLHHERGGENIWNTEFRFDRARQWWKLYTATDGAPRMTFYAMADGAVAIYDPFRNGSPITNLLDSSRTNGEFPNAFVFSPSDIWNGLKIRRKDEEEKNLCNGLIWDWASWQNKNGREFKRLENVLAALSPEIDSAIHPGEQTRISIDDVRDMPTVKMAYSDGEEESVAVVHASAGMRRIISLAYLLVWMWEEHVRVAQIIGNPPADEICILFDEVECHLHPSWQRKIVPALLEAVKELSKGISVQLIATTHSPLVMASLEPHFDHEKDAWFDLDLDRDKSSKPEVKLSQRNFRKYGDAESWLQSRAFDLKSTRSLEGEALLASAKKIMNQPNPSSEVVKSMHQQLVDSLDSMDEFLDIWRLHWYKKEA